MRRSAKYWGDFLDEESDSERESIPHSASPQETWNGIMNVTEEVNNDLSADAISALDAGLPYIGEAQARSFLPINTAAPSEVSSYDGYLSALDIEEDGPEASRTERFDDRVEGAGDGGGKPCGVRDEVRGDVCDDSNESTMTDLDRSC